MIGDQPFGFMLKISTTDAIFWLRMMMDRKDDQKELHCVFNDLERPMYGMIGSQSAISSPSKTSTEE